MSQPGEEHVGVEAHVKKWLEDAGSALELRVARTFRRANAFGGNTSLPDVHHSRNYVDQESGELRETDVVVRYEKHSGGGWIVLTLVVECKSSKEAPWVLFRTELDDRLSEDDELLRLFQRVEADVELGDVQRLYKAPVLRHVGSTAYQVSDAKRGGKAAYSALQQVTSSVDGVLRECVKPDQPALFVFVPVIVTSAPLFWVALDGEDVKVEPAARALAVQRGRPNWDLRATWIVHESDVKAFAEDAAKSFGEIGLRIE